LGEVVGLLEILEVLEKLFIQNIQYFQYFQNIQNIQFYLPKTKTARMRFHMRAVFFKYILSSASRVLLQSFNPLWQ